MVIRYIMENLRELDSSKEKNTGMNFNTEEKNQFVEALPNYVPLFPNFV